MTKKLLLAGIALGALTFAGAASAHDLTYRATGPAGAIVAGDTNTSTTGAPGVPGETDVAVYGRSLVGLYLVAQEAVGLANGVLALEDELTAGSLPSGNTVLTVTLTNATFGANFAATAIQGGSTCDASFTVVRSTGGNAGDSSARFIVSNSSTTCNSFTLDVPVSPSSVGTVSVTTNLETEGGNPIDGGSDTLEAIYAINAFQPTFNGNLVAAGAEGDDFALLAAPTYTTLSDNGVLGKLAIYVDTRAQRNLTPGNFVATADVVDATVRVESSASNGFSAFDGAAGCGGNPTLEGNPADFVSGNAVVFSGSGCGAAPETYIVETLASKPNGSAFQVVPDGGVIPVSDYRAFINYDLNPTFYNVDAPQPASGQFERIGREGTNVIFPMVTSAPNNGTTNIIRLGNMSGNDAGVSVQLRNTGNGGTSTIQPLGTLEAFDEMVITPQMLAVALGNFGRGDVEIIVEAAPGDVTARRFHVTPNGITELRTGSVATDQTPADVNDVP